MWSNEILHSLKCVFNHLLAIVRDEVHAEEAVGVTLHNFQLDLGASDCHQLVGHGDCFVEARVQVS